jgi:hypothetical protein
MAVRPPLPRVVGGLIVGLSGTLLGAASCGVGVALAVSNSDWFGSLATMVGGLIAAAGGALALLVAAERLEVNTDYLLVRGVRRHAPVALGDVSGVHVARTWGPYSAPTIRLESGVELVVVAAESLARAEDQAYDLAAILGCEFIGSGEAFSLRARLREGRHHPANSG